MTTAYKKFQQVFAILFFILYVVLIYSIQYKNFDDDFSIFLSYFNSPVPMFYLYKNTAAADQQQQQNGGEYSIDGSWTVKPIGMIHVWRDSPRLENQHLYT